MEPGALSLGVKRPGREADHSPPSSAEVKNAWSYTSVKAQGQLKLNLTIIYNLTKTHLFD